MGEKNNYTDWCGYRWKASMEGGRIMHPEQPWYWFSMDCVNITDSGELHLFTRRNPKEIKYWDGKTYCPVIETGTLCSIDSFRYGIFSAEIRMPKGMNLWPSFWLSGDGNWPPEIDIVEGWTGNEATYYRNGISYFPWFLKVWHTTNNVHYRKDNMKKTSACSKDIPIRKQPLDPAENFIEYKCVWKPNNITIYANETIIRNIGKCVSEKMVKNIEYPERGYRMNVIFNVWTENPDIYNVSEDTDMCIRNFKYVPI